MAKAPIGNRKLFVGGVPQDMHQTDLYSIFSEYGKVKKAWVQKCKRVSSDNDAVQNHRGFGFIIFVDESTIEQLLCGSFSRFIMLPNGRKLEIKLALSSNKIASDPTLLTQGNQAGRVSQRVLHVATGGAAAAVAAAAAAAAVAAAKTVAVRPSFPGVPIQPPAPPMPSLLAPFEPLKVKPTSFSMPPDFSDFSLFPSDVAAMPRFSPPGLSLPNSWTQKTMSTFEELMADITSPPMMPLINAGGNQDISAESEWFANKL